MSLETAVAGPVRILGNRHLLFQAVANLLDNAVKYAPTGGRIVLGLHGRPDGAEIWVADNVPGIPESEREHVLERFVRLDTSRTTPGSGLGLSLVAAIVHLHGASLRLEDNDPGLKITIRFKPVPHLAFGQQAQPKPNVLTIELDPDRIGLTINVNAPGDLFDLDRAELDSTLGSGGLPTYARLLLNVLNGDQTLSIRDDEAEESWRIVEPILEAWAGGSVPLIDYPAGSNGPAN